GAAPSCMSSWSLISSRRAVALILRYLTRSHRVLHYVVRKQIVDDCIRHRPRKIVAPLLRARVPRGDGCHSPQLGKDSILKTFCRKRHNLLRLLLLRNVQARRQRSERHGRSGRGPRRPGHMRMRVEILLDERLGGEFFPGLSTHVDVASVRYIDDYVRSEERRVGKECRCGWWADIYEKKNRCEEIYRSNIIDEHKKR